MKKELRKATIKPSANSMTAPLSSKATSRASYKSKADAAKIVGMDKMKEKRAASDLWYLNNIMAMMTAPALETPGTIAIA